VGLATVPIRFKLFTGPISTGFSGLLFFRTVICRIHSLPLNGLKKSSHIAAFRVLLILFNSALEAFGAGRAGSRDVIERCLMELLNQQFRSPLALCRVATING